MQSLKCPKCNLLNFATSDKCKRCENNLISLQGEQSNNQSPSKFSQHFSQDKISTVCPKCGSSDTQSFQMAYQTGTSFEAAKVASYNNELGVFVGNVSTSNQTILASQVNPPIKPNSTGEFLIVLIVIAIILAVGLYMCSVGIPYFCSYFLSGVVLALLQVLVLILTFVIGGLFLFIFLKNDSRTSKQKLNKYEIDFAQWLKSWVCLRCGSNWTL